MWELAKGSVTLADLVKQINTDIDTVCEQIPRLSVAPQSHMFLSQLVHGQGQPCLYGTAAGSCACLRCHFHVMRMP